MKELSNNLLPVIFVLLAILLSCFSIKNQNLVKEKIVLDDKYNIKKKYTD